MGIKSTKGIYIYMYNIYIHTYNIYIIGICTGDIWWRKNKNPCLGQIKITKACLKHGLHHHKHQTIRGNFERTKLTYMHGWIHNFGEHGLLWTPIKTSLFHPIGSSATWKWAYVAQPKRTCIFHSKRSKKMGSCGIGIASAFRHFQHLSGGPMKFVTATRGHSSGRSAWPLLT